MRSEQASEGGGRMAQRALPKPTTFAAASHSDPVQRMRDAVRALPARFLEGTAWDEV